MTTNTILLFDVMETLVTEPFFTAMPSFFGMSVEQLREEIHPTSWIEFEEGRITELEYYARFFSDGRFVDADAFRDRLVDAYDWLDGMEPLLAELRDSGYEMHVMSNYSTWYLLIEEKLQLARYLEWSFVSCNVGLRKPDKEIFLEAARRLNVPPERCLFVDDRPVNVEAARAVGMDGILKTDAAALRAELVQRAILG
jgi:HAD superfamily hydrolase (TIGR01509 family)